jgi:pimeloyl-ACP methyl ester carboxylesterase/DNA-binding winged helix-turn-helix (wHTH) protein
LRQYYHEMLLTTTGGRISFPPFQLDLSAGRLSCGPKPLDLPPKAFGVLRYLAERPGQLISKEELLQGIWPDVHVSSDVLKVTIAEIRKVLDDPCREPRFIETAHRRGYRFVGRTEKSAPAFRSETGVPPTRYARSGDVNIAYQVVGDGPLDLVFVMGWVSHLEYFWTEPSFAKFLRRLSSFSRLILFDKRGTGLSDRVPLDGLPTLEQRMEDVRAVMDAVGSRRAALCGVSEGGAMAALFAATYPERTAALVMIGSYAKRIRDASYPFGPTEAQREEFLEEIREQWGGPVGLEERAPSMASNSEFRRWWAAYLRTAASPGAAVALTRMNSEADIRSILPAIRVPTLVAHRTGDRCLLVEESRYMANRIPGARFVELPGVDHLPFVGDQDSILDEVQEFLTGVRHSPRAEPVLATVLSAAFQLSPDESQPAPRRWQRLRDHIDRELEWSRARDCSPGNHNLLASFDGPARAIRCAQAIAHYACSLGIRMRAGLHIGECEICGGVIRGAAVETARSIAQSAEADEILASATVRDLVAGSGVRFRHKGTLEFDGVSAKLPLLVVDSSNNY